MNSKGENGEPDIDRPLVRRVREMFNEQQWTKLMEDPEFRRLLQSASDQDRELVSAYALQVLGKRTRRSGKDAP